MKKLFLLWAVIAGSALGQNQSGNPVIIQGNGGTARDDNNGLQELSPPLRAGRRGGVYIAGSTNPYSLGLSNAVGATGSSSQTNSGAGASTNRSAIVVTNNGITATNYITNLPPNEILYPPVIPGVVPPSPRARSTSSSPGSANSRVVAPEGTATAPNGTAIAPPGTATSPNEAALPPTGIPTPPPGAVTPPPPIRAPAPPPRR